jgi:hypothetical protein
VSPIDFSVYNPPGVYTETVPGPQIGVQASTPSSVAIYGVGRGYQTDLETIVVPPDTPSSTPVTIASVVTTSGSPNITGPSASFPAYLAGLGVTGTGIPDGTTVLTVTDATHAVLSANATASGTITLSYRPPVPVETQVLRQKGIDKTSIVVTNVADGTVYAIQTTTTPQPDGDYTLVAHTGPSGVVDGPDSTIGIKRVLTGGMNGSVSIQLTYNYTNATYFTAHRIFDFDDVVSLYGTPFDTAGNVVSEISLAAKFAFNNGASTVILAAVAGSNPSSSDYANALSTFEGIGDIAIVVCANGAISNFGDLRDHVVNQSNGKYERRAILGMDGVSSVVTSANRISQAQSIENSRLALVSPSSIQYYNPNARAVSYIGSQYLAAALAGVVVAQSPAQPLTRKQIAGFVGVDTASDSQKNLETQGGVMVIDTGNSTTSLRVRHGVTTDPTDLLSREWSILGQQDAMAYRIRSYFESNNIIGSIISDLTLSNVKSTASSALESLTSDGIILAYTDLKVRQDSTNLDVIQIGFSWQPSLPLNYIDARFTINVTSGDTDTSGTTTTTSL